MTKARDIASATPAPSTVSATELGYLDGVTSAVQTQIDSKIGQSTAINPTIVDAKGDIIAATAADTVARLAVGANDTVLTADSSTATGLKWAAPSSGGMTLLSTTTLSGSSVTLSSIPQTYNNLQLIIRNHRPTSDAYIRARFNSVTTSTYYSLDFMSYGISTDISSYSSTYLDLCTQYVTDNSANSNIYVINLYDYTNTVSYKMGDNRFFKEGSNGTDINIGSTILMFANNEAISSIVLSNSTSDFTSGTVLLYGVK
jgi:hypothetical protein